MDKIMTKKEWVRYAIHKTLKSFFKNKNEMCYEDFEQEYYKSDYLKDLPIEKILKKYNLHIITIIEETNPTLIAKKMIWEN